MSRFDLFFVMLDECNEIIDSAIAKRIIDLHCDNLNDLDITYNQEEIIRYINFAKHFKPVLNEVGNTGISYLYITKIAFYNVIKSF